MAKRRKNGTGSVHLRKDGRWEGRYVIGYDENGYPKTKNVLARTKADCVEKPKALKAECGKLKQDTLKPGMTFGDWLDFWYQNYSKSRLRPTTQQSYEDAIYRHTVPELGNIQLNQLTQNNLQQFYASLKENGRLRRLDDQSPGLSDRTVRNCHAVCRSALEKAVAEGLIRINPAVGCRLPPKKDREMQVLTREEMLRFLIQAREERYYELFLVELATGLRRGEILALQWSDLNFETGELQITKQLLRINGELTVSEPKTRASIRTVILPRSVVEVLKRHRAATRSRWMFPSPVKEDAPLDPASVRKRLQLILERAQCRRVRFHDLRHLFCTTALEHGMDVKTLSAVIGHTSAETTLDIYTHITSKMQEQAAISIDRKIGNVEHSQDSSAREREAPGQMEQTPAEAPFQPYKGKRRRPGTGCVTQINDRLWEGRYSPQFPDGKKHPRNVYAHSREECEEKLATLIKEMKAEINAAKVGA